MPRKKKDDSTVVVSLPAKTRGRKKNATVSEPPPVLQSSPIKAKKTVAKPKVDYPIPVDEPVADNIKEAVVARTPTNPPRMRLPDPFIDLPEKTRSYLRLYPYGDNIIIDKKLARGLIECLQKIHELPLPDTVWKQLMEHQDRLRAFLGYISVAEFEEPWRTVLKDSWEPFYPTYKCKCFTRKRRPKGSKPEAHDEDDD